MKTGLSDLFNKCKCKALARENERLKAHTETLKSERNDLVKKLHSDRSRLREQEIEIRRLNRIIENTKRILDMAEIEF